jgi:hypothetical protein
LFQDLQKKLSKAEKLLEPSHDTEKFGGIGKYKLCIVVKNSVFWDITLRNPAKVNRHFGGTCCFHYQRMSQAGNQQAASRSDVFPETLVDFRRAAWH